MERTLLLVSFAACAFGSGCALGPGGPFAELSPSLDARWVVPQDRARDDGFARLASDYAVRVTHARVTVGEAELLALRGGGGGGGGSFDPARPPPGYSLCHGGHCHRDDGALIPYAQIEAELAGGGAATLARIVGFAVQREVDLLEGAALDLGCEPSCELDRGLLTEARAHLGALRIEGVVRDLRAEPRIAGELPFTWEAPSLTARAELALAADRASEPRVDLTLNLHPSPRLFDAVDWTVASPLEGETGDRVLVRAEGTALTVELSRSR